MTAPPNPVAVVTDTTAYLPADVLRATTSTSSACTSTGSESVRESDITDYGQFSERLRTADEAPDNFAAVDR